VFRYYKIIPGIPDGIPLSLKIRKTACL